MKAKILFIVGLILCLSSPAFSADRTGRWIKGMRPNDRASSITAIDGSGLTNYNKDKSAIAFFKDNLDTIFYGNVGIGTTSPGAKLHVSGGIILLDNNQFLQGKDIGGTARALIGKDDSDITTIVTPSGGNIQFKEGTAARLYIQNGGNVGIGTTEPHRALQVKSASNASAILIQGNTITNGEYSQLGFMNTTNDTGEADKWVRAYRATTFGDGRLALGTNNKEQLTIDKNGNVGIGTTSPNTNPNTKLDVQGLGSFTSGVSVASGTTLYFGENGAGVFHDSVTGEVWAIDDGGTGTQLTTHDGEFRVEHSWNIYTGKERIFETERFWNDVASGSAQISDVGNYITYSERPKIDPIVVEREKRIKNYMRSVKVEVPESEAFEEVDKFQDSEIVEPVTRFKVKGGKVVSDTVIEKRKGDKVKVGTEIHLKAGVVLDTKTGKLYRKPTKAEAEAACPEYTVGQACAALNLPEWVIDKVMK